MNPTEATILCPGPSLDKYDPARDKLDGPVIAINVAMAAFPDSDVWAIHKEFKLLTDGLAEYGTNFDLLDPREVWAMSGWDTNYGKAAESFHDDPRRKNYIREIPFSGWPRGKPEFAELTGWESRVLWSDLAVLCAAGKAISRGIKRIRIVGCDMMGTGYGCIDGGPLKWKPDEDDLQRRKWRQHRSFLEKAVEEASAHGVEIEVWRHESEQAVTEEPVAL